MIFTWHNILDNPNDENCVSPRIFERQIRATTKCFNIVPISQYDPNNPKQAVIRFDDGYKNILTVLPVLKKYHCPFEVYIVGNTFNTDGYLGFDDVHKIRCAGGHLQWHTNSHADLTTCPDIDAELKIPSEIMAIASENDFISFAYPFWRNNATARAAVSRYFKMGVSGNGFAYNGFFRWIR